MTAIAFGIGFGTRGRDAFESIVGGIGFTVWALVFGILFLVIAFPAVAIVHGTAATIGYLCARGLWHLVRRSEDEVESRTVDGDADAGRN